MPNPKSGTVTMDVAKAVKEVKQGKIDFKVDKSGIVHTSIGNDQEFDRYTVSTEMDERTLREIYLPPFKAAVQRADIKAVTTVFIVI